MAEGNGEIVETEMATTKVEGNGEVERTSDYPKLVEYGLDKRVCSISISSIMNFFFLFIDQILYIYRYRLPVN